VRFKVIDSLNAAKNDEIQLSNDSDAMWLDALYLLGTRALLILTYLHSWLGLIKPAISPKRLKIERKLLLTAYIESYTGFRLPPKCMTLNDLCARFKVIYTLNAARMAEYSLVMTPTACRVFCLW